MRITVMIFLLLPVAVSAQKTDDQLRVEFDKLLSAQFKVNEPGATVLVASKGKIIYEKGFGLANVELNVPMTSANVFKIGSITKQFTGVAILQLVEQGKINLNDPITKYIPGYPMQGQQITVENLLTHTSGIQDHVSMQDHIQRAALDFTPSEIIDHFKDSPLRFATGSRYEYSNSNYTLLGFIIEKLTGKSYGSYIEEKILQPAGMNNSLYADDIKIVRNRANGYSKTDAGYVNAAYLSMTHPYAAGAIMSTVKDLFKWQQALLTGKLVKRQTLEKAFQPFKLTDGSLSNYGYGWRSGFIQESPSLWHGGLVGGFNTMSLYLPKEDVLVVVFTNSNADLTLPTDVSSRMAALTIGQSYDRKPIVMTNDQLQTYTGVYENKRGQLQTITLTGNQLFAEVNRAPRVMIKPYAKNKFYYTDDPFRSLEIVKKEKGEIEVITKTRTEHDSWTKTNKSTLPEDGIKVEAAILDQYVGEYELSPELKVSITREQDKLFAQMTEQDKIELFAETMSKFSMKVNDATLEFVKEGGRVTKVLLMQGNRKGEAKKIK